ncbi:MAG: hypothetical protein M0C28_17505 [Candidatus Moduliflexus flocculans]|nr:hypothetical protein [Candidatus Moduliflexus flocculans]
MAGLKARLAVFEGALRIPAAVRDAVAQHVVALHDRAGGTPGRRARPGSGFGPQPLRRVGHAEDLAAAADDRRTGRGRSRLRTPRGLRLKVGVPIEYQSLGLWQESATFNLSSWGVFIRTPSPFAPRRECHLAFSASRADATHPRDGAGGLVEHRSRQVGRARGWGSSSSTCARSSETPSSVTWRISWPRSWARTRSLNKTRPGLASRRATGRMRGDAS